MEDAWQHSVRNSGMSFATREGKRRSSVGAKLN